MLVVAVCISLILGSFYGVVGTSTQTKLVRPSDSSWICSAPEADAFGFSVSISEQTGVLAIGAPGADGGEGAVFLFLDGLYLDQLAGVGTAVAEDNFGLSVASYGSYILVSSPRRDSTGTDSGCVTMFIETSTNVYDAGVEYVGSDTAADDFFGIDVAIYDTTFVAGSAPDDANNPPVATGAVYVFIESSTNANDWTQTNILTASGGDALFGASVALYDTTLVVGSNWWQEANSAYLYEFFRTTQNAAYVFDYDGGAWTEVVKLVGDDTTAGDGLGHSVAVSANTIAVSAVEDGGSNDYGSVYVFAETTPGAWTQTARFDEGDDQTAYHYFGESVDLVADSIIAVGVPNSESGTGALYIFTDLDMTHDWIQASKVLSQSASAGDKFGIAVAITSDLTTVHTGAFREDYGTGLEDMGAVYTVTSNDACVSFPCANGGTCSNIVFIEEFACDCTNTGYDGDTCANDIDDCASSPCLTSEYCTDAGVDAYTCNDIDDCASSPCQHGGICTDDGADAFTCDCAATGYDGATCEIDVDDCVSSPCANAGSCTDTGSTVTCDCAGTGYTGSFCTDDVDDCASSPCSNGDLCVDAGTNAYTCTDVDDCLSDPCQNGGVCTDGGPSAFTCDCTSTGTTGTLCESDIDDCTSTPCNNGGTCHDDGINAGFTCNCTGIGAVGTLCEIDIDDCLSSPCQNGAVCSDVGLDAFQCECLGGWSNDVCDTCSPGWDLELSGCLSCLSGFGGEHCDAICDQTNCAGFVTCDDAGNNRVCESCIDDFFGYACLSKVSGISGCNEVNATEITQCNTAGGDLLTVDGVQLDDITHITVDGIECTNLQIVDSTSVTCALPQGVGTRKTLVLFEDERSSPSLDVISYSAPIVVTVSGCAVNDDSSTFECPRDASQETDGGRTIVTLVGSNFGEAGATVYIGTKRAEDVTHMTDSEHSVLTCTLPYSTGTNVAILVIQQNGQVASALNSFVSYADCDPGTFNNAEQDCEDCAAGTYTSVDTVKTYCVICSPGTYQPEAGQVACDDCPAGRYTNEYAALSCDECPAGTVSSPGDSECKPCSSSKQFAPEAGMAACIDCPPLAERDPIDPTQCICQASFYADEDTDALPTPSPWMELTCRSCPDEYICNEPGQTLSSLVLAEGYWRGDPLSIETTPCPSVDMCPGGNATELCIFPRYGPLCALCAEGFVADSLSSDCNECLDTGLQFTIFILLFLLIVGLCIWYVRRVMANAHKAKNEISTLVKIALSAFQINSIAISFAFVWDGPFNDFIAAEDAASSLGTSSLNFNCLLAGSGSDLPAIYYETLFFLCSGPFVILLLLFLIPYLFCTTARRDAWAGVKEELWTIYRIAVPIIFFVLHPTLTRRTMNLFYCTEINGTLFLAHQLDEVCWEGLHFVYAFFAGITMLVVYVLGLPLSGLYFLYKNNAKIHKEHPEHDEFHKKYSFFYKGYAVDDPSRAGYVWGWEGVVSARKVLLMVTLVFFANDSHVQSLLGLLIMMIALCTHMYFLPFTSDTLNLAEFASLLCSFITFYLGQFTYVEGNTAQETADTRVLVSALALATNIVFLLVILVFMSLALRDRFEAQKAVKRMRAESQMIEEKEEKRRSQRSRSSSPHPSTRSDRGDSRALALREHRKLQQKRQGNRTTTTPQEIELTEVDYTTTTTTTTASRHVSSPILVGDELNEAEINATAMRRANSEQQI